MSSNKNSNHTVNGIMEQYALTVHDRIINVSSSVVQIQGSLKFMIQNFPNSAGMICNVDHVRCTMYINQRT